MISINQLSYAYPNSEMVLKNVNLEIKAGEIVSVMGRSGSGKSTLLLALNSLIPKSIGGKFTGNIHLNGKNVQQVTVPDLNKDIQIMFQNSETQFFSSSVEDEIRFGLENLELDENEVKKRIRAALNLFRIQHLRNKSPEQLSSGEKQLAILAALTAMQPKILVLDEPTANLDPLRTIKLMNIIKELRRKYSTTVIIGEHSSDFAKISDRVFNLKDGALEEICVHKEEYENKKTVKKAGKEGKEEKQMILKTENLKYSYGERLVLNGVNLTIKEQSFVGIVGFNGCGKSTLALNIAGVLKPQEGKIFFGRKTNSLSKIKFRPRIGFVFQNPDHALFESTVMDELMFGPKNIGVPKSSLKKKLKEILAELELNHLIKYDPNNLSLGQKRLVNIASVLAMNPDILIVDEPDTGLDFFTASKLMNYLKKINNSGSTVIIISHNMGLIRNYCDEVFFLDKGRIQDINKFYSRIQEAKNDIV